MHATNELHENAVQKKRSRRYAFSFNTSFLVFKRSKNDPCRMWLAEPKLRISPFALHDMTGWDQKLKGCPIRIYLLNID